MNKLPIYISLLVLVILITGTNAFCQQNNKAYYDSLREVIKKRQAELDQLELQKKTLEEENKKLNPNAIPDTSSGDFIILNNNLYKTRAGWFSAGVGPTAFLKPFNFNTFAFHAGLTVKLKEAFVKFSYNNVKVVPTPFRSNYLAVSMGNRNQTQKHTFAFFAGLSYSFVWQQLQDSLGKYTKNYRQIGSYGIYGECSYFFRPVYDIGIGATAFANLDFIAPIAGIRLDFYFSNAFKKKVK